MSVVRHCLASDAGHDGDGEYSHGGPAWDTKLREAVTLLEAGYQLSCGLSYGEKAAVVGAAEGVGNW